MVRILMPALLVFASSALRAQSGAYTVTGKIPGLKEHDKIYLVYRIDDLQPTDSTFVKDGQFVFRGKIDHPVDASLFLNKNPYVDRSASRSVDYLRFWLEAGATSMTAADSLKHIVISGSRTNELQAELRAMRQSNDSAYTALNKEAEGLTQAQRDDTAIFNQLLAREKALRLEGYRVQLRFVEKHPDTYFGLVMLSNAAPTPELTDEATRVYGMVPPALKATPLGKSIAQQLLAPARTKIGVVAPDFEQKDPNGKVVRLSEHRKNKYLLVDFWASWCGPCREENPNVVAAYRRFKDKGFDVLGVSLDQPGQKAAWVQAIKSDSLPWTQVSDLKGWNNEAAQMYGVRGIPANFLLDPDGKIIARDLRGNALMERLETVLGK